MIYTSNYSKNGTHPNAVSIAGRCPEWYTGRQYKKLAPKIWFFKKYKEDGDEEFYKIHYRKEVLDVLDPNEVYREIGENAILLCWEKSNCFCHRHLVGEWLEEKLGIVVIEL